MLPKCSHDVRIPLRRSPFGPVYLCANAPLHSRGAVPLELVKVQLAVEPALPAVNPAHDTYTGIDHA